MTTLEKIRNEIEEERVHADWDFGQEIYYNNAIDDVLKIIDKYAEQEPCDDVVSREDAIDTLSVMFSGQDDILNYALECIEQLPSVRPQEPKTGHCKDCKYFEYDSVAKVDGVPLIVAHEICNRWGDGCKTKEDGYCFLFEPQERSDKE